MASHADPARSPPSRSTRSSPTPRSRATSSSARSGLLDLSALGLGAIIGTGIFVILGEAIGDAGPAILLSFVLAGVTCAFSALSYAELASTIPVVRQRVHVRVRDARRAGRLDHRLGPDPRVRRVGRRGRGRLGRLPQRAARLRVRLDAARRRSRQPPGEGGVVNLPAVFLVLAVASLLIAGLRESARANTVMVFVKIAILLLFIVLAFTAFNSDNLTPFAPEGFDGVVTAASLIFFAYIGFDAISTSGEETKRPAARPADRDPRLAVVATAALLPRRARRHRRAARTPARRRRGAAGDALPEGAGFGCGATVHLGRRARRDHIGRAHHPVRPDADHVRDVARRARPAAAVARSPADAHAGAARPRSSRVFIAALAAVVPLAEIAKLVNIGTLFAFLLVNVGVIVLRRTRPDLERGFRVPFVSCARRSGSCSAAT